MSESPEAAAARTAEHGSKATAGQPGIRTSAEQPQPPAPSNSQEGERDAWIENVEGVAPLRSSYG
jgi:hypothetical protein